MKLITDVLCKTLSSTRDCHENWRIESNFI